MILPISLDRCLCEPFTDFANITSPKENGEYLTKLVRPFLDVIGCTQSSKTPGLFFAPKNGGAYSISEISGVTKFSASGGILSLFRANKMLDDYLMSFSEFQHQVSMLHATCDYDVDAPKYLKAIYKLATSGKLHLSRKAMNKEHVHKLFSLNNECIETGSVYMGQKQNYDVWAKAYDKRHERIQKGFDDCGQMLRIEMAIQTDVGASLRDISNPHDIYYQFAGKSLVEAPKTFLGWVSGSFNNFSIDRKVENYTTWQQIKGIIENSTDFKRVFELAKADYGLDASQEISRIVHSMLHPSERIQVL